MVSSAKKILKPVLIAAGAIFLYAHFFKAGELPGKGEILPQLYREPGQVKCSMSPFEVKSGKLTYTIRPLYDYRLYGMIVSQHRSSSWWDYYHRVWKDTLNIKDIGVLWGSNLKNEVYKEMKFKSGSWTLYWYYPNAEVRSRFNETHGSNNHLLATDGAVIDAINKARTGDQVYFEGCLAEYSYPGWSRGTSVSRNDTGSGACEVVFVTKFEILKQANIFWRKIEFYCKTALIISFLLYIFIIVKYPLK
ncbi:MAG: hypothetical protein JW728_01220 [Candidatus Aureabacteria bacterium]|nr:hypothetical protein [Candidatus Auribacterota bacterium]